MSQIRAPVETGASLYRALGGIEVNREEALWLRSKGFPLEQEFFAAVNSNTEELRRRAQSGDLVARVILGGRMARNPATHEAGIQLLKEASADGSLFALHELSDVYRESEPIRAVAYFRAALALGDIGTIPLIHHAASRLSVEQRAVVDYEFAWLLAELNRLSIARRGVPLSIELRPFEPGS
jgi:hypothetical protein